MKTLALISGGKDSCFNMMHCVANGHQIVALGNLYPSKSQDEIDSYMFQTVGHDIINLYSECMDVPTYRQEIKGKSLEKGNVYTINPEDEVEDLYCLLKRVQEDFPDLEAVSTGAILSGYQRVRVENVCSRLGLISLGFLWQKDQQILLNSMVEFQVEAILVKVASVGLNQTHLGKSIGELQHHLSLMHEKYGLHVCGEGGEYETMTLNCPLFKKKIEMYYFF